MKALVYEGPESLSFKDMPDPVARDGEDLIKIESSGICGSDMHAYLGHDARRPPPFIFGHEASGIIHGGDWDGKRVTVNPLNGCGECRFCKAGRQNICPERKIISMPPRQGAFAEWVSIPRENLVVVPDDFELKKAALVEPIACGWHAVKLGLHSSFNSPDHALIQGGGAIGVGAALCALAQGVERVTLLEPNPIRQNYLKKLGICDIIGLDDLAKMGEFDLIIDAVGIAPTRADATAKAAPGGVIAHIGLGSAEGGLDVRRMTLHEITFIGTYTYTPQDFKDTAAAMFDGRLGKIDWTEERPLEAGIAAFPEIHSGQVAAPKTILIP